MLILDTDHLSEIVRETPIGRRLIERLDETGDPLGLSIVTVEEHLRGRLSQIARKRDLRSALPIYRQLQFFLDGLTAWSIVPWEERSVELFENLAKQRLKIGTMDLKIASIAMANNATLLSRNMRDFERVPGLTVEDWLQ